MRIFFEPDTCTCILELNDDGTLVRFIDTCNLPAHTPDKTGFNALIAYDKLQNSISADKASLKIQNAKPGQLDPRRPKPF